MDDARVRELAKKGSVIQGDACSGYLISVPKMPAREQAFEVLSKKYGS